MVGDHSGPTLNGVGTNAEWAPVGCPVASGHSFLRAQWGGTLAGAGAGGMGGVQEAGSPQPGAFVPQGAGPRAAAPSGRQVPRAASWCPGPVFARLMSQGRPLPGQRRLLPWGRARVWEWLPWGQVAGGEEEGHGGWA